MENNTIRGTKTIKANKLRYNYYLVLLAFYCVW